MSYPLYLLGYVLAFTAVVSVLGVRQQKKNTAFLSGARWQQDQIVALIEARAATYLVSEPEHRALIQLAKIVKGEPQPERVK